MIGTDSYKCCAGLELQILKVIHLKAILKGQLRLGHQGHYMLKKQQNKRLISRALKPLVEAQRQWLLRGVISVIRTMMVCNTVYANHLRKPHSLSALHRVDTLLVLVKAVTEGVSSVVVLLIGPLLSQSLTHTRGSH